MDFYKSSGNVFADLDVPQPETALLKAKRAMRISELIDECGLTQQEAAKLFGVSQPRVSRLVRWRLEGVAIERLIRCLSALGQKVEIVVQSEGGPQAFLPCGIMTAET
jgi:predicted XRE-type DNA-binding protein